MNRIKKKSTTRKRVLVGFLVILLLAFAAAVLWHLLNTNSSKRTPAQSSPSSSTSSNDIDSDTASTSIPDDVDPSSIKPYTTVTENETYKIRRLDNKYVITLYAIINRPEQSEEYYDQLRQYKQDALDYLTNQSIDVSDLEIQYEPAEAANL